MNITKNYKLSDDVIAHIAKALQIALLTGTDIVDNLRMVELTVANEKLVLSPDCQESFNSNLEAMIESVPAKDSPFSS